jgi:ribosomal protein S13
MRELHFQSVLRTKDLEIAYHTAKLDQQKRAQEVESSRSNQLTRQVSTFSQTETELRTQLNIYVEKFKQVCSARTLLKTLRHFLKPVLR